jgi:integrase
MSLYPAHGAKRRIYSALSVRDRIAKSRADGEPHTIAVATLNGNYIDPLRGLCAWAMSAGQIVSNPFAGIKVTTQGRARTTPKRPDFTVPQLQAFFASPLFTGSAGLRGKPLYRHGRRRLDDWHYWLPLMALFTGARLSELGGLRLSDFSDRRDGASWFHIQAHADGRGIKTKAADRLIPVHAELVRLGLLNRVERLRSQGSKSLFPDLMPGARGSLSDKPSKFFADLIDRTIGKDQPVVFHSLPKRLLLETRDSPVWADPKLVALMRVDVLPTNVRNELLIAMWVAIED